MMGFGKNMGILLVSITVILTGATFLTTQNLGESASTTDVGFLMGHMTLTVMDGDGFITDYRQTDNVIVDDGWDVLVQNAFTGDFSEGAITTGLGGPFSHIGLGSSGDTPALDGANTALGAPLADCPREAFEGIFSDGASTTLEASEISFTVFADFFGNSGSPESPVAACALATIDEAGVFNDVTTGEMFARNTFIGVDPLGIDDSLFIDWTFTFTGIAPPE